MSPRPDLSKVIAPAPYRALPCYACPERAVAFGLHYCALGRWKGIANEKACEKHPANGGEKTT